MFAISTPQESPVTSEADLTPDFVAGLEEWAVVMLRSKIATALKLTRQDWREADDLLISAESMLLVVQGKRLAVVQASVVDRVRDVSVMGFKDGRFYKVACMRESSQEISVFFGKCGRIVSKTFDLDPPETPVSDPSHAAW